MGGLAALLSMSRIDSLTAQMRQRAIRRVSIQADERMKLFGEGDQFLGAGAALPVQTVTELLSQIAPEPLDGTPITFPYNGRDGQFEISVAPGGRSFEVRALSFAPASPASQTAPLQSATAQNAPLQNTTAQNAPLQTPSPARTSLSPTPAPATQVEWFYFAGDEQRGPHSPA